jgi:hypothetical protein
MATLDRTARPLSPAVVTKAHLDEHASDNYLFLTPLGQATWVEDPEAATAFASMREATRMAMRLPSNLRAFSLPRETEIALRRMN